ncbi:MAG: hypothetical protein AB2A00_03425 [Myxococcota bacterium]
MAIRRIKPFDPAPSGRLARDLLKKARVPAAVVGRLAVWHWIPDESQHAFTKDLDLAVSRAGMIRVREVISGLDLTTSELPIGGVNVSKAQPVINVDFIDRASSEWGDLSGLFTEAVQEAQRNDELLEVAPHVAFHVVSPEHLTVMKLATGMRKDEEDAVRLLEHVPDLDIGRVREIVRQHLDATWRGRLEQLLRDAGHRAARPSYALSTGQPAGRGSKGPRSR